LNLFIKNPKFTEAVIVASWTVDFADVRREWRPEREYCCKRSGLRLDERGLEETEKVDGMTFETCVNAGRAEGESAY
jgi:hypothetical protein